MDNSNYFSCKVSDIRHIRISCRCGIQSIAEVPQQMATGNMLYPCPGCGSLFSVHQNEQKVWEVKRLNRNIGDGAYIKIEPSQQHEPESVTDAHFIVGMKVRIVEGDVTWRDGKNLHPKYIGKVGTITGLRNIEGCMSPLITLDDGAVIGGWECWWEPYSIGGGN